MRNLNFLKTIRRGERVVTMCDGRTLYYRNFKADTPRQLVPAVEGPGQRLVTHD